ncbi:MAG TPA: ShlB/FhaC/HecB family hemolysin secretion/activation protein [Steroidobacteraceae bacterium]|nr:ShlB/FhaC/HecB family hemolysin secretion/activation protein [Steroidobacteraceae bacterium]
MQVTISGGRTLAMRARNSSRAALVISLLALAGGTARAAVAPLTTSPSTAPKLTTVVIDGSSVYPVPRLFATYRDQLGQPISRDSARAIVDAIVALYEGDGYVKPELALDDSLTGRGVLRVRVHEAQITHVGFDGDTARFEKELQRVAAKLESSKPLRRDDVPQALRELRQLSGVAVTASTRRDGKVRNAFELTIKAEYSAIDGVVRMNNRGTDQVGPAFVLGQLFANGVIGRQGKAGLIFASATDPEEYFGGGLYADAVASDGTRFSAMVFDSHSAPNEAPVNLDDTYDRRRATLRIWRPLRDGGGSSLSWSAAFDAEDLFIDRAGTELREERLRVFEWGGRAGWRSSSATQYSAGVTLRKGLDGFGAGLQASYLADDPRRVDFLVTRASASVYKRFATDWSVRLDALGQVSAYVLPDSERFKIGGDRLGRGFEVAEIAGDTGIGGKLELRRDLLNTEGMFGRLSTYGFYDTGTAWKQDAPGSESASTAGAGFAIQGSTITGYIEVAAPVSGADIEGRYDPSVFAELSYRF